MRMQRRELFLVFVFIPGGEKREKKEVNRRGCVTKRIVEKCLFFSVRCDKLHNEQVGRVDLSESSDGVCEAVGVSDKSMRCKGGLLTIKTSRVIGHTRVDH